jgi:D-methionine transport system substrate-binding protein
MKLKKIGVLVLTVAMGLALTACGGDDQSAGGDADKKEITVACVETSQALVDAVVPIMAEQGYTVTYEVFDNNMNTLSACNDGSVDSVFVVHKPFMESFNSANNGDLVMMEPYIYTSYMGLFSEKYDSIDAIPDGATIAIPNDVMNMDRALRILAAAGLISIDESVEQVSIANITENPKNLQLMDMDQTQVVRSLADTDGAVAFFSHMRNAGKDFNTYLAKDSDPNAYPTALVVKAENQDAQWAIDLNAAFLDDEVKAFAEEYYGGLYEYYE